MNDNNILEVFPGDWIIYKGRLYWVCECEEIYPLNSPNEPVCPLCLAKRPAQVIENVSGEA